MIKMLFTGLFAFGFFYGCRLIIEAANAAHAARAANLDALFSAAGLN